MLKGILKNHSVHPVPLGKGSELPEFFHISVQTHVCSIHPNKCKIQSTYAQSDINGLAVCKIKNEFKIKHKYIFKVPGFKVGNI